MSAKTAAAQTYRAPAASRPGPRLELTIRPGVTFPNWSVVHSERAEAAASAIFEVFGIEKCWIDYRESEDRVRRAVLDHYASDGHAPSISQLSIVTDIGAEELRDLLTRLKKRDLLVLDESGERITGAYPFAEWDTGHRVHLKGRVLHAMCAIDALGAGAMYGEDVTIESACRACGEPIQAETEHGGTALKAVTPATAIVWSGVEYAEGCAATSLCTVIAFFCSDQHLRSWRDDEHPDVDGFRLSIDEAQQVGMAIFTPMLAPATSTH